MSSRKNEWRFIFLDPGTRSHIYSILLFKTIISLWRYLMIDIYFIRHGQASFGNKDYDKLTQLGKKQARLLGQYFNALNICFDNVYAGSLKRHRQTAEVAIEKITGNRASDIVVRDNFNELGSSDVMMERLSRVIKNEPEYAHRLEHVSTDPGAIKKIFEIAAGTDPDPIDEKTRLKNAKMFIERVHSGISQVVEENPAGEKVAVFSSGGPMAVMVKKILDLSRKQTIRLGWEIKNSAVSIFRVDENEMRLVLFNGIAHLELENKPELITYI